jgi:hypothetical protein
MSYLPLILSLVFFAADALGGRTIVSARLARDVVHVLQNAALDAFAVADSGQPGRFVAALYVPEQLLVIETTLPSRRAIEALIAAGQYRDVYLTLHSSAPTNQRFFVLDADADGLLAARAGDRVDAVYDGISEPLLVTGHPSDPDRSEADYEARLTSADTKYARALNHLKAGLEQRAKALRQLP